DSRGPGPGGALGRHRPRDPGHHHRRPRRAARRAGRGRARHRHDHPDLLGLPGDGRDRGRHPLGPGRAGVRRRRGPLGPEPGLDDGVDERGRPREAAGVRHRAAHAPGVRPGARHARPPGAPLLPAVQQRRRRGAHALRLDLLQVAVAVPRLPGAVRPLQGPL
ncbi:MAG: 1,2-phenylacetyl-CoA epoxidase, subunit D, partial [uncultured Frankineae bacterium]